MANSAEERHLWKTSCRRNLKNIKTSQGRREKGILGKGDNLSKTTREETWEKSFLTLAWAMIFFFFL